MTYQIFSRIIIRMSLNKNTIFANHLNEYFVQLLDGANFMRHLKGNCVNLMFLNDMKLQN